jgi:hypothetical protein
VGYHVYLTVILAVIFTCRQYTFRSGSIEEDVMVSPTHPLLEYYRGAAFMDQGGYRRLVRSIRARPPDPKAVRISWLDDPHNVIHG